MCPTGTHKQAHGKRNWTKNKLEELRRRSPGHDSPADRASPGPQGNMADQNRKRRLICFIGGLDMCDGRYDTPRHSLFHTLATVHSVDFHQACITGADLKKGGKLPFTCMNASLGQISRRALWAVLMLRV